MTGTVDLERALQSKREQNAARYTEIVITAADGGAVDAEEMSDLMTVIGKSAEQFKLDVDHILARRDAQRRIDAASHVETELQQLRQKEAEIDAEVLAAMRPLIEKHAKKLAGVAAKRADLFKVQDVAEDARRAIWALDRPGIDPGRMPLGNSTISLHREDSNQPSAVLVRCVSGIVRAWGIMADKPLQADGVARMRGALMRLSQRLPALLHELQ